jgi:hypothetical protein
VLSPAMLGTSARREKDSRARAPKPTAPRRSAALEAPVARAAGAGRQQQPVGRSRAGSRAGGRWWWRTGRRPRPPAPGKESPSITLLAGPGLGYGRPYPCSPSGHTRYKLELAR